MLPRSGGAGQRPDLVAGCSLNPVLGGARQYFDPNCFALPAAGTLGNVPRNTLIGPGYGSLDMAIFKNIPFGGGRRLQLRAEGFNVDQPRQLRPAGEHGVQLGGPGDQRRADHTIVGTARQFQFGAKFEF